MEQTTYDYKKHIAIIEDFPEPGISFKNINTLVKEAEIFKRAINDIAEVLKPLKPDYIVGPEARGFLMGSAVAYAMGIGFIPIRKEGKLPGKTIAYEYDLLATGGTVSATTKLLEKAGAEVVGLAFLIELESLGGRKINQRYPITSLVKYNR